MGSGSAQAAEWEDLNRYKDAEQLGVRVQLGGGGGGYGPAVSLLLRGGVLTRDEADGLIG